MACMGDALRTAKIQIYVCEVVVRTGEGEVRKEDKIETERINGDDRPLMRLTNTHTYTTHADTPTDTHTLRHTTTNTYTHTNTFASTNTYTHTVTRHHLHTYSVAEVLYVLRCR
jgi:hypothetical protein